MNKIKPTKAPRVYNSLADAALALENGRSTRSSSTRPTASTWRRPVRRGRRTEEQEHRHRRSVSSRASVSTTACSSRRATSSSAASTPPSRRSSRNGTLAALQSKWLSIYTSVPVDQAVDSMADVTDASLSDETPSFFAPRASSSSSLGRRGIVASRVSTVLIIGGLIAVFCVRAGRGDGAPLLLQPARHVAVAGRRSPRRVELGRPGSPHQHQDLPHRRGVHPRSSDWHSPGRACPSRRCSCRFGSWRSSTPTSFGAIPVLLVFLLIGYGFPALQLGFISNQSLAVYGCIGADTHLHRLRRRGLSGGHLLGAERSAPRGALPRPHERDHDAPRDPAPGRAHRDPAAAQRLHLVAEGHRAALGARGRRSGRRPARSFRSRQFNSSGLVVASLLFLALTIPLTRFTDRLIARDRARRLALVVSEVILELDSSSSASATTRSCAASR